MQEGIRIGRYSPRCAFVIGYTTVRQKRIQLAKCKAESLFVFGLGYTGVALCSEADRRGWNVAGTCRSMHKAEEFSRRGISALVWDGEGPLSPQVLKAVTESTHLVSTVPPLESGDVVATQLTEAVLSNSKIQWMGYLSSTSVYTETSGGWVTEQSATDDLGKRRKAEVQWLSLDSDCGPAVQVFRLAGIYGPQRNALSSLRNRKGGDFKSEMMVSRIHVGDIVKAITAAMLLPHAHSKIVNLADDYPASRKEVFSHAAQLLGMDFDSIDSSPRTRRDQVRSSKRVSNSCMHRELLRNLQCPTYTEGLTRIHEGSQWPFRSDLFQVIEKTRF